jgi:chorismate mutase
MMDVALSTFSERRGIQRTGAHRGNIVSGEKNGGINGKSMDISEWRKKIDQLDEQIVQMISERAVAANAIGELKHKGGLPVYEPKREQAVFEHVRTVNPGPLPDQEIQHIFERIMDVMRSLQRRA